MSDAAFAQVQAKLAAFGQEHVLQFWPTLSEQERAELLEDISTIDLEQQKIDFQRAMEDSVSNKLDDKMQPVTTFSATASPPSDDMQRWSDIGLQRIAEGKVATLLLAGGQGTRLGSTHPKGMFHLHLHSGNTLFQIQALRIRKLQQLAEAKFGKACVIPWYIMTSGPTQAETKAFFESHRFFGLKPENVVFFEQNTIPALDNDGKMFLETKNRICRAPDGNGGLYSAMRDRKIVDDMAKRGIENVHVYCVDNILVNVADPTFVGFCVEQKAPAGALVVPKSSWKEKVGVLCKVDNLFQVVEYSEIVEETAKRTNADGVLTFNAGNICNHFFTVDFLRTACAQAGQLKLHVAKKKIPHIALSGSEAGERVEPHKENGIKIEKFVFDVFLFANEVAVLEVKRESSFSPLKNAAGADNGTAAHCRNDLYQLHRSWLQHQGVKFVDQSGFEITHFTDHHAVEINPLVSYAGEGLEAYAGKTLAVPCILGPTSVTHL